MLYISYREFNSLNKTKTKVRKKCERLLDFENLNTHKNHKNSLLF